MAQSIWAFGTMNQAEEETLAILCQRGPQLLLHYRPIDCSMALVGLARLETRPRFVREFVDNLLHHVTELSLQPKDGWKARELANVLWSLSKLGVRRDKKLLLDTITGMVMWNLEDFNMQVEKAGGGGRQVEGGGEEVVEGTQAEGSGMWKGEGEGM